MKKGGGGTFCGSVQFDQPLSHLTAGLASGNRKYDITALTFRNVGMSGRMLTLLAMKKRQKASRTDTTDNSAQH